MMGFNGLVRGAVQFHPTDPDIMVSYTGRHVVIANIKDPHQQEFLKGHNEEITCLAISPMGNMIASGQVSSTRVPNSEATVIVWDYRTRLPVYRLMELHDGIAFSRNRVRQLAFSPDDLFLAGSDDQPGGAKLCIWHTTTGQLAAINKTGQRELDFLAWGEVIASQSKTQRHSAYSVQTAADSKVTSYKMKFDVHTMQFGLKQETFQLPSSGLVRSYNAATAVCNSAGVWFLVAGSKTGELCVFNAATMVFRACVPVSKGGLLSLFVRDAGDPFGDGHTTAPLAYCGCGDGTLKLLQGEDLQWTCLAEAVLDGEVRSVSVSADGREVIAGTSLGNIYRLDAYLKPLAPDGSPADRFVPLIASHPHPISCIDFGGSSEWFITAADSGCLRRWELSNYGVDFETVPPVKTTDTFATVRAECLAVGATESLSGWTDGNVRCYSSSTGAPLWEIVGAHRGGVSCIVKCPLYLVTGGADGALRVWSDAASRSLVGNFDEHSKRVTGICVDINPYARSKVIHSCGEDKKLVSVDLDQARRVKCQTVKEGAFRDLVQMDKGEFEVISADTAGALKWWDSDYDQPVSMMYTWSPQQDPNKDRRLTSIQLSPPADGAAEGSDFLLACTAAGELQVWDLAYSQLLSVGSAHSSEVTMAKWSPDGKQIVSVGKDACVCVWNWYGTASAPPA